jgi:hypothetical protein
MRSTIRATTPKISLLEAKNKGVSSETKEVIGMPPTLPQMPKLAFKRVGWYVGIQKRK